MSSEKEIQAAVDKNFAAFQAKLPKLVKLYLGKYVLLRDGEVVHAFDSAADAMIFGEEKYPDGLYSIQEVTEQAVDLGFFSHAVSVHRV